jgi:hypothetical protein
MLLIAPGRGVGYNDTPGEVREVAIHYSARSGVSGAH